MEDASQKLNAKQETALAALLAHGEVRAAAKSAKVGETTLWRWLKDEQFAAAYRDGRRRLVEACASRLTSDSTEASKVLLQIAKDKKAPASARVSAAKAIIENAVKAVETLDLEPRLKEIEKNLAAQKGGKR
jgi:Transposase